MVENYRHGVGTDLLELPGGFIDLWQQSARAWIESYKEVVISSQKIHNSWLDTIWWILGTRQDQGTENPSTHHDNTYNKKKKIRALILQEGGALGAYQAGAFKALYEKLTKEDIQSGNRGRPLSQILQSRSFSMGYLQ